ncbi:MAG: hypothetical protein ABSF33_09410 [Acidimicrobiales bacterium]|jgi:hypothetical protein
MSTEQFDALRTAGTVAEPRDEVFTEAHRRLVDAMAGVSDFDPLPEPETVRGALNGSAHGPTPPPSGIRRLQRRSRALTVAVAVVAVAAASLVMALVPGSVGQKLPEAEAAQLRFIATNAARQPVLQLGPDQWLRIGEVSLVSLQATHQVPDGELDGKPVVASEPIADAAATVRVTSAEWYNSIGQACVSVRLGAITFASSANQAAWQKAGLRTRLAPLAVCPDWVAANAFNGFAQGIGAVNVSSLTSDPALLATQLQSGATGIPGLDQGAKTGNQGFEEAVALLTGPITGKPASFGATLYKAIALIPGIEKLGNTTTRTGQVGLGFAGDTFSGRVVIVIDPSTGTLLEVQDGSVRALPPVLNAPVLTSDLYPPSVNPITQGFSVAAQVKWSDSSGARSVVPASALPSDLQPPPTPVAVMVATAKPTIGGLTNLTSTARLNDPVDVLERQLDAKLGDPGGGGGLAPIPGAEKLYLVFTGSKTQVDSWAQALRSSGMFVSVEVDWGDTPTVAPSI